MSWLPLGEYLKRHIFEQFCFFFYCPFGFRAISIRAPVGERCPRCCTASLAHHTSKKEPTTVFQLEQLVTGSKALSKTSLYGIQFNYACWTSHFFLLNLSSQTDKYRDGAWVVVGVSGKARCLVDLILSISSN